MEQARRVKGRDPVTATCRIAAARKLGVGGSGPLGSPPDSHPVGLRARRGAGHNLGSQRRRCGSRWACRRPLASPPVPPPTLPSAYLGQPQLLQPRSRAPAKGTTDVPLRRLLLRRPFSPCSSLRSGVCFLFHVREPHDGPGTKRGGPGGFYRVTPLHGRSLQQPGRALRAAAGCAPRGRARPHRLPRLGDRCRHGRRQSRRPYPPRRCRDPAAAGSGTTERRSESASLMRPPRPPGLRPSERQPMSRAGAGRRAGRRRRALQGGRRR